MTRTYLGPIAAALAIAAIAGVAALEDTPQPSRRFDFYKIGRLSKDDLTPRDRAALGISYLKEEVRNPTGSYRSLGGTIDHVYIVAQLVLAIARPGADRDLLWQEFQQAPPGEYRDALALTLDLAADRRITAYVVAYLQDVRHHPDLRERAARALSEIKDPGTLPVLVRVLYADPVYEVRHADPAPQSPLVRHYPLRRAAKEALRYMEKEGLDIGEEARDALAHARVEEPSR
ncbi:MAG: HEAT repeat domain-containing protein [Armatimonadetes bacterium]|nr:HEAT repeat domain-containing protein [Armatimonadota bacterium]